MAKTIIDYINEYLSGEIQQTALKFVYFLQSQNLKFYKDNCDCWKDKVYYWVTYNNECVCFIAIADPDEPQNLWTVWSDESKLYEDYIVNNEIKQTAWTHVDLCGNCGSCNGGKQKTVFGKTFDRVCSCTFRIDNPTSADAPFMKRMVEIKIEEILKKV
ncbi:MAG: hypothetical protein IJA41_05675 [Clostridia bacterium]|nr:hypothetical protein [Clostridia bacterium]